MSTFSSSAFSPSTLSPLRLLAPALAPTLAMLIGLTPVLLNAADGLNDQVWSADSAVQGKPPADWSWRKAEGSSAGVSFADDQLVLTGDPATWSTVQRNLGGMNGTDAQPLIISCAIAAEGRGALTLLPAVLVVRWGERDLLAIGLVDHAERHGDDASSWAGWLINGKRGDARGQIEPYQRDSPVQVRVVVTSKVVLAQASRDGYDWRTVTSLTREGALSAAPSALELGHGWLRASALDGKLDEVPKDGKAQADKMTDKDGKPLAPRWCFSGLRVGRINDDLPAALTSTYQRKESADDTRDALYDGSFPTEWQLAGPFTADQDPLAAGAFATAGVTWKPVITSGKASERILQLDEQLPGVGGLAVRYARFTITCEQPRQERFLFDGLRETTIILNGRIVVRGRSANDKGVTANRMGASAWLKAGVNTVLIRVVAAGDKGEARLVLRHEPGDPRWRVAVTKRLLSDFPPEPGLLASERLELGRAWQAAGNVAAAAAAFAEAAAVEDAPSNVTVDALTAQAGMYAALHDDAAQAAAVLALGKAWAEDGSNPLVAALRGARLHVLLGRNDLAIDSLNRALSAASTTAADRLTLVAERMRIRRALGQDAQLAKELTAFASALPVDEVHRVPLLAVAARAAVRPVDGAAPARPDFALVKAAALASRRPADLQLAAFATLAVGDQPGARALAKVLLGVVGDTDPLLLFAGETSGDELVASAALRRYLGARALVGSDKTTEKISEKATLGELRYRLLRLELGASAEGAALLAAADTLKVTPAEQLKVAGQQAWKVVGPFGNDNWSCYATPPVDPGKPDTTQPVAGKVWKDVVTNGSTVIDINGLGIGADNSVVVFTTTVDSQAAADVMLSCGADDGLTVWLNGVKLHEDRHGRACSPDSLHIPLSLKAGSNRLTAMIQNGGGGFAFQARVMSNPVTDLARLLAFAAQPSSQARREELAGGLLGVLNQLHREGRPGQSAIALATMRCFTDMVPRFLDAAMAAYGGCDGENGPWAALPEALAVLDRARIAGLPPVNGDLSYEGGQRLRLAGDFEAALQLVESALLTDPDPSTQSRALLQHAYIHSRSTAVQAAIPLFSRVVDDPALDPDNARGAREQLTYWRRAKGGLLRITPPFEATSSAGAVARMTAAQDVDGVVLPAQKLIEGGADFVLPGSSSSGNNSGVSVSGWVYAVQALRSLGAPAAAAYRAKFQTKAEGALRNAALAADSAACERVALRWPLCSTRGPALLRAAELYRIAGDPALARATAVLAVNELGESPLKAQAQRLAAVANHVPLAGASSAMRVTFPMAPNDAADLARLPNRLTSCTPAVIGDVLVLHHGNAAWGLDAVSGAQRWLVADGGLRGSGDDKQRFTGLPAWQTAAAEDLVAVRQRSEGLLAVLCLDPADGALRWSSAAIPELARMTAVSSPVASPCQVIAAFANPGDGSRRLVSLDAVTGRVRWSTSLPSTSTDIAGSGDMGLNLAGHAAAPVVIGRELYWCTDGGCVVRLDAANGALQWLAPYPRAVLDLNEGEGALVPLVTRGASRAVVVGEQVLVAPRDCLGVYALERSSGALRWSRPLTTIRELAGSAPINGSPGSAQVVIAQGRGGVEALDAADGDTIWKLPDLATRGTALCEAGGVFVDTDAGVLKLEPASGKVLAKVPWATEQTAGRSGAGGMGTLLRSGKSVLAIGEGQLVTVGPVVEKPVTLSSVASVPLTMSGVSLQADGTALGIIAQWAGGSVQQLIRSPTSDECYVLTDQLVARIAGGPSPQVDWQVPVAKATSWGLTKNSLFGAHDGVITLYDRTTGVRRPAQSTAYSPRYAFGGNDLVVTGCPEAILCFRWGGNYVDVLDPATGERWMRHQFGESIAAATVREGHLSVVRNGGGGGIIYEVRDARTGAPISVQRLPFDQIGDLRMTAMGPDHWLLGKGEHTYFFDLSTKTGADAESRWNWNNPWPSGAETVGPGWGIFRESGDHGFTQVYNAERKLICAQEHYKVRSALFADHAVVQHVDNSVMALKAINYGDGKQRWRWDADHDWNRWPKALFALGERTLVISQKRDGFQRYNVLDAQGKMIGEGPLPGAPGSQIAASLIGERLWLGTAQGLSILGPCTPEALKNQNAGDAVPVAERRMRDFNSRGFGPDLACGNSTIVIDGDVGDWPAEPVRTAVVADHRTPAEPGAARLEQVELRAAFDGAQVAFAIEVREPTGAPVAVRLGLDTRGDDGQRPPTPVIEISNRDGVTAIHLVSGSWAKGGDVGDLTPTARAVQTLDGWRFEIGLPWPLLRDRKDWRPGDRRGMRYGVMVSTPGDRVEFGHGLALGTDWTLWPGLKFLEQPGKPPRNLK